MEKRSVRINEHLNNIPIWKNLEPQQKKIATISIISVFFLIFILFAYNAKTKKKELNEAEKPTKVTKIDFDRGEYEKKFQDVLLQGEKEKEEEIKRIRQEFQDQINSLKKKAAETNQVAAVQNPPINTNSHLIPPPPVKDNSNTERKKMLSSLPLPSPPGGYGQVELIGGISSAPIDIPKKKTQKIQKKQTIYLPPSFVEATLLSGVAAQTASSAKNEPVPLLFRIKDLAILPNSVKANLKGCFVIGEGTGKLADERVHCRLTTLSCVSKNGESVIDQKVKGWVEDNGDGKVGLAGRVVAKMGMHVARSALAGFIGGFGEAMSSATQVTALTDSGTISSIFDDKSAKNYTQAGIGEGIKNGSEDLSKFYLDLAEQAVPVIEVLSLKDTTIVFSEGVELEIKDVNLGGR